MRFGLDRAVAIRHDQHFFPEFVLDRIHTNIHTPGSSRGLLTFGPYGTGGARLSGAMPDKNRKISMGCQIDSCGNHAS